MIVEKLKWAEGPAEGASWLTEVSCNLVKMQQCWTLQKKFIFKFGFSSAGQKYKY